MPHEDYCYALERETEDLRKQLAALKSELKTIGKAVDDPRTDLTMTMSEIIMELKQQLSEALSACKVKDEALGYRIDHPKVIAALAIQPADLSTVILCHANPVGQGLFDTEGTCYSTGQNRSSMCINGKAFRSEPLYRAWEPKL